MGGKCREYFIGKRYKIIRVGILLWNGNISVKLIIISYESNLFKFCCLVHASRILFFKFWFDLKCVTRHQSTSGGLLSASRKKRRVMRVTRALLCVGYKAKNTCAFILVSYGFIFIFLPQKGKIVVFNQGEILFMGE